MANKAIKICLTLFIVALGVLLIYTAYAQIKNEDPEVKKLRQLILEYRNKKAQGYDTSEIEEIFRSLKEAKERGERHQFTTHLKNLVAQLETVKPLPKKSALTAVSLDNSPWPMYCHDPQHTCRSSYKAITSEPLKKKWAFTSPGGHGICSPTAIGSDGTLYFGTWKNKLFVKDKTKGHSGVLYALMSDGSPIWQHDSNRGSLLASAIECSPLLTSDGKIIYGKDDGHVYALNLKDGKKTWEFETGGGFAGSPAVAQERLVIANDDGVVYCFGMPKDSP